MNKLKTVGTFLCASLALILGGVLYQYNGNDILGNEVKHYESVVEKKDCTVLVYMDGSNLESSYGQASKDIEEMIKYYPKDENINIVCESGGAEEWYKSELEGEGNTRFTIDDTGISNCNKIEARNMGEKDTLADFINYGIESYPADKYVLVFWNHGGGSVDGFGSDELFYNDSLNLSEMAQAFEESVAKKDKDISLNLSLLDLSKVSDLVDYLNSNLSDDIGNISLNRNNIKSFGNGTDYLSIGEMVDIKSLLINMNISDNSNKLNEKINNLVIYKISKNQQELDSGVSIYLPVNDKVDLADQYNTYKKNQFIPSYINFIKEYDKFLLDKDEYTDFNDYELSFNEKILKVNLGKEEIKNISVIYLAKCKLYKDNIYYYISTDSDVDIDRNGSVTSNIENDITFINSVPVCTIERSYNSEYLECLSPALLDDKKVNLIIKYNYYNSYGAVVGAVPANEEDTNSKIIDIKEGDKLIPLYPIRGDVDLSKSNEADIYDGKYIKGQSINLEDGYLDLTMGSFSDDTKMVYGYIIVNNKQEYYETNFIE